MSREVDGGEVPEPEKKPRYLDAQDVADRYGLSRDWAYHCKSLRKYARKIGKFTRWLESDLEDFELGRDPKRGFNVIRRRTELEKVAQKAKKVLRFDIL